MHQSKRSLLLISVILLLLVGVVYSCCSCAMQINASTVALKELQAKNRYVADVAYGGPQDCEEVLNEVLNDGYTYEVDYTALKGYSNFLDSKLSSTVITRYEWLKQLTSTLGIDVLNGSPVRYNCFSDKDYFDGSQYFITAVENGIVGSGGYSFDPYSAATRQYVSTTLINAVGYSGTYNLSCDDYEMIDDTSQAAASVCLGYFELDENNCFNPYDAVTEGQVEYILSELETLVRLKGHTVMSFGDSIMHGDGNNYEGIADLMAERYKMTAIDYSKGGSTFGVAEDREQISNQILTAIENRSEADIILINGGTNDMRRIAPGTISEDFEYGLHGREDFASGMEYALGLLRDNYPDTPVLYVRAHDMEFSIERNELHFGKLALDICEKWEVEYADIFSESGFDGHNDYMNSTYTAHTKKCANGDSVHPNRLGYYKFYLPIVSEKTAQLLGDNGGYYD